MVLVQSTGLTDKQTNRQSYKQTNRQKSKQARGAGGGGANACDEDMVDGAYM